MFQVPPAAENHSVLLCGIGAGGGGGGGGGRGAEEGGGDKGRIFCVW